MQACPMEVGVSDTYKCVKHRHDDNPHLYGEKHMEE